MFSRDVLMTIYNRLMESYGPQFWWPADTQFEVIAGAVLTQNTAWTNVEKALENLRKAGELGLDQIHRLDHDALAALIRPSGYFNIKSRRLKTLCDWMVEQGGLEALEKSSTAALREGLLSLQGIGPETADDILLYAFNRPVFVIDAYTRRLLMRLGLVEGKEPYETLRRGFEISLDRDTMLFNEYHALIVRHAKEKCTFAPDCRHCSVERRSILAGTGNGQRRYAGAYSRA